MKSQRATFKSRPGHLSSAERHRRSDSGAAVRLTRGGELGRALGFVCSSGAKTGYGFRTALGRAWGMRFGLWIGLNLLAVLWVVL